MRPNFSDGKSKIISSEKSKNIRIVWRFGYFRVISNVNENKKKKTKQKYSVVFSIIRRNYSNFASDLKKIRERGLQNVLAHSQQNMLQNLLSA